MQLAQQNGQSTVFSTADIINMCGQLLLLLMLPWEQAGNACSIKCWPVTATVQIWAVSTGVAAVRVMHQAEPCHASAVCGSSSLVYAVLQHCSCDGMGRSGSWCLRF
jgi:hypothetical protein